MSTNEITGDALRTRPANAAYREGWDGITKECPDCGKKTPLGHIHTCSPQPNPDWPEEAEARMDIVGQNGNTAEHYEVVDGH